MRVSEVHAAESVAYLNRALAQLRDIWEEIGVPEDQRLQRTRAVHEHVKGILDLMIAEEEQLKIRVMKDAESYRKELAVLCTELQLPQFEEEVGCTILQLEKYNRTRLEQLKEQKRQRMEDLRDIVAQDRELCDIMCTPALSVDLESVPSLKQLEDYHTHVVELTKEKERRQEEFISLKQGIIACINDLERQAETSFEKDVMCEDDEAFCLSKDNIEKLKKLLGQLQACKAKNEQLCAELRTKLRELWDRLKIPLLEQENFSEHMMNSKKSNIEALQAEVQRLQLLRLHSIKSVIEAVRAEISDYWDSCFFSQEQREAFRHHHDDNFTEELLNLHEAEIQRLKAYFEEHKELFEGVTKWQENWTTYLELDRKANDPMRFNNRGGNLLREEKQRSDLQKSLPKLEKTLKVQIDCWEQEQGKQFLVNGQKFLDYVQQQWEQHHVQKEKEKMERQLKKSKQTQEDMLWGTKIQTPSKRKMAGTPTPTKMRKMGISTLCSDFGGTLCQSSMQKTPLPASKGLSLRTPGQAKTPHALEQTKENLPNRGTAYSALRGTCQRPLNRRI
ncbi:protein regulator of cytokinesis 1-like isoform X2 [Corythoichthys intestinalis]|uniref:protein regulator of cytokinesis 1-like isoform X2 n=1 Tax=Corythoichthys intestinalis TaxID=161448 RepID=UPI0025A5C0BE|nr:protein regulator of cytokinesis 1-like isoform X2 [Corythoichthys intestinalis]